MVWGGWPPPATPSHPSYEKRKNNVFEDPKTNNRKILLTYTEANYNCLSYYTNIYTTAIDHFEKKCLCQDLLKEIHPVEPKNNLICEANTRYNGVRTVTTRTFTTPDTYHPGHLPLRTVTYRAISTPDSYNPYNFHPGQLPRRHLPPGQFPPG